MQLVSSLPRLLSEERPSYHPEELPWFRDDTLTRFPIVGEEPEKSAKSWNHFSGEQGRGNNKNGANLK